MLFGDVSILLLSIQLIIWWGLPRINHGLTRKPVSSGFLIGYKRVANQGFYIGPILYDCIIGLQEITQVACGHQIACWEPWSISQKWSYDAIKYCKLLNVAEISVIDCICRIKGAQSYLFNFLQTFFEILVSQESLYFSYNSWPISWLKSIPFGRYEWKYALLW